MWKLFPKMLYSQKHLLSFNCFSEYINQTISSNKKLCNFLFVHAACCLSSKKHNKQQHISNEKIIYFKDLVFIDVRTDKTRVEWTAVKGK